ncbi:MAG TPA: DUF3857 domain-containing protein [Candidatus Angelobacter sp.]
MTCASTCFFPPRAATQSPQTTATWPPISKEELELKDNPSHPGDVAIVLYREVQTDNARNLETHFTRIKILKEQGKKYGDVEIPYLEEEVQVENIRARTVAPDGQAIEFGGTIYDKVVLKTRRFRLNVKAFSLSNVQPGSILDYSYTVHGHRDIPEVIKHPEHYLLTHGYAYPAARWPVQRELSVRRVHFILHPFSPHTHIEIRSLHLPKIAAPQTQPDGTVLLDVENVPGVREEEYSPPEETMRGEVYLFYVVGYFSNDSFWSDMAGLGYRQTVKFLAQSKLIQQEVARLSSPNDTAETKLRKLYERVQQIRAVSFEPSRTEKEKERENLKPNKTAEEVLQHGYAFGNEINLLFVAMAREAGFQASPIRVTSRNRRFFVKSLPNPTQLDAEIVEVRLPEKTLFLDPATLHCPFGLLPWEETDTDGIRLEQFNGSLVKVPVATSAEALIERKATFRLDKDGNLDGKLEVSFLGQEALVRRINGNNKDEAARKKELEEETRVWLPQDATVKLTSTTGWEGASGPLRASFDVQSPSFATQAGDRLLLPVVVLRRRSEKVFQTTNGENPVYLKYSHQENDEVMVEIPQGYKLESVPAPGGVKTRFASYARTAEQKGSQLKLKRSFTMDGYAFTLEQYPGLHDFYDFVRINDEEQAILQLLPAN